MSGERVEILTEEECENTEGEERHALFCEVVSGYKPPTVWAEKIEEDEEDMEDECEIETDESYILELEKALRQWNSRADDRLATMESRLAKMERLLLKALETK